MKDFLYFLSNTNKEIIARCHVTTQRQQLVQGLCVLHTGVVSALLSGYAVFLILESALLAIALGVVIAIVTSLYYRPPTRSKTSYLFKLLLLIMVGYVLSVPLQLLMFHTEIDEAIIKLQLEGIDQKISVRSAEISKAMGELAELQRELIREREGSAGTGTPGEGPAYGRKRSIYEDFKSRTDQRVALLSAEITKLEMERESYRLSKPQGFLLRMEALRKLQSESPTIKLTSWLIVFIIILLEITPLMITFMEAKTDYHEMVELEVSHKLAMENFSREWQLEMEKLSHEQQLAREELSVQILRKLSVEELSAELLHKLSPEKSSSKSETPATNDVNARLAIPGFSRGFSSAVDWLGTLAPTVEDLRAGAKTPEEADIAAMTRDWTTIGNDLRNVLNKHEPKPR